MVDFNMDAPASGCASDLGRRSYDPLSTDDAAASYRAIVVGDLPVPPHSSPRGHLCRCRSFERRDAGHLPPVTSAVVTPRVVFSTLVPRRRDSVVAVTPRSSPSHPSSPRSASRLRSHDRSEMETGSGTRTRRFTYGRYA